MDRIFFKNKNDCFNFFEEVKVQSNAKNWCAVGKIINTNKSMIESYRQGKFSLPENRFNQLLGILDNSKKDYFLKLVEKRSGNWGQIIGGKNAYILNKKQFDIGRNKAIRLHKKFVKYNFNINMPLSEELCEFVGAIIGDGFTNKYINFYQIQIAGDRVLDSNYYYTILKPMCINLFKINPKITEKENSIRLNIYSKRLFEMLTKRFGIPAGVKSYTVEIPKEILNSDKNFLKSTLMGMFNTDGGLGFDKRKSYKTPYVRINYTSVSKRLIKQLDVILTEYSIPHSIHKRGNALVIQINGVENVKRFNSKIGFSNERHLKKIRGVL